MTTLRSYIDPDYQIGGLVDFDTRLAGIVIAATPDEESRIDNSNN